MMLHILYAIIIGYLLGSIPFALVISKLFYHTDIRTQGSGNLGGTNAGRVLGKKVGLLVIILDISKVILASFIVSYFDTSATIWAGLAAAIGHCFPIFAGFKGGKAVATMVGFLISAAIFTFHSPFILLFPLIVFVITLLIGKMVSLASMLAAITSTITICCYTKNISIIIASVLLTLLIIIRHKDNIKRMINGNENKISF